LFHRLALPEPLPEPLPDPPPPAPAPAPVEPPCPLPPTKPPPAVARGGAWIVEELGVDKWLSLDLNYYNTYIINKTVIIIIIIIIVKVITYSGASFPEGLPLFFLCE